MGDNAPAQVCPLCGGPDLHRLHARSFQGVTWNLAHCKSCDLHFTDPTPTDKQIRRFYSGDSHAQIRLEGASEKAFGNRFRRYVDWITTFIPRGRAVDIGCATGLLPKLLGDRGFRAEGIEYHPETARWGAAHYGIPIRAGGLELISSEADSYDLVTLTEVVEHMPDPVQLLKGVNHILKRGGYALVTFPDISAPKSRYYKLMASLTHREWVWVTCHIPLHIWEFTYQTARATFDRSGFSIVGFRRAEVDGEFTGKEAILMWAVKPLNFGPIARRFGSQMEFVIRKNG
jgi:2-polyprenyl-3-methyl-5-hydroxy-6-metoxy-1,4-benzoquinol methylase